MLCVKGPGFPCMWLPVYLSGHASSMHSAVTGNRQPRGPVPFWQPSSSLKAPHPFPQLFNGPPVPIHLGPSVIFKDHLSSSVWKETMLRGRAKVLGRTHQRLICSLREKLGHERSLCCLSKGFKYCSNPGAPLLWGPTFWREREVQTAP